MGAFAALFGIGTGLQMFGQVQAGKSALAAADYNNKLAQREAANTVASSQEAIRRQREGNAESLADLQLQAAASGVQTTTGTPLVLAGTAAGRLELGIADAARNASMHAASQRAAGKMALWEGQQAKTAAYLSAAATGVKGISSAAAQFK